MNHTLGTLKLTESDKRAVLGVVESNWLSPGEKVKEFERSFSATHNQRFGIMTNSGTDALRIALMALKESGGWKDGDVVYVPSVTFVSTVNVVLECGLTPHLVDVNEDDFNLSARNLAWSDCRPLRARCVIPVHLSGKPCDLWKIKTIAAGQDLAILEDSCEAMGIEGIAEGDISCFSFYAAHLLTTGVGGMATTEDEGLRNLMWSYANHGRREPKQFRFDRIGYSCRATEFEAALGLNQLLRLQGVIDRRRKNAEYLVNGLKRFDDFQVTYFPGSSCMFLPVVIKEKSSIKKHALMAYLGDHGIETRELMPLTNQPCYEKLGLWQAYSYPVADWVNRNGFYIGCHQDLTQEIMDNTVTVFQKFLDKRSDLAYR